MAPHDSPFEDESDRYAAGRFGMVLFLVSLVMIFAAAILAYVVVRLQQNGPWPPPGMPELSGLFIISTIVIVVSSITMACASHAARIGANTALKTWIILTLLLGIAFLVLQAIAWIEMAMAHLDITEHLYAWSFYVLTGLHAMHVIGGVIPLLVVTIRAFKKAYSPTNHRGVAYVGMYWHFLDVAWLVLYASLLWGSRADVWLW